MPTTINIGFIGLGNIGKPIAKHLITNDYQLYAYDVYAPVVAEMAELGAVAAASPAAIAKACDYIGICVRDDNDVEGLLYGEEGLLATARANSIFAIHSTVTQAGLLRWADDARAKDITIIDAPITGGASGAEAGTLCYMIGGDEQTLEACRAYFETSADKIVHAGALGTGIALKLCNNLITYAEFTAMSEATRLAEACGLSADVLREVGKSNGVINENMHSFISNRNALGATCTEQQMDEFFGTFGRLGYKDLQCAIETGEQLGVKMPATEMVREMIVDVFLNKA